MYFANNTTDPVVWLQEKNYAVVFSTEQIHLVFVLLFISWPHAVTTATVNPLVYNPHMFICLVFSTNTDTVDRLSGFVYQQF